MSEMVKNTDLELHLKETYAQNHSVNSMTWSSPEYKEWREGRLAILNQRFDSFLKAKDPNGSRFYDTMNPVYKQNMTKNFMDKSGLTKTAKEKFEAIKSINAHEAKGEFSKSVLAFEPSNDAGEAANYMLSSVYSSLNMVEKAGKKLMSLGVNLAKDTKKAPILAQVAGVACMALGAEIAVGMGICKTLMNPSYPASVVGEMMRRKRKQKNNTSGEVNQTGNVQSVKEEPQNGMGNTISQKVMTETRIKKQDLEARKSVAIKSSSEQSIQHVMALRAKNNSR